nr:putative capsid protein [Lake Sarah-associated circular virus-19]ALE29655.1 putative capsid protein [Lake Sarah-associated circular virus-19]ALE29656.1 putative capsid protein [Lake Sarah-associated circular virus-19]
MPLRKKVFKKKRMPKRKPRIPKGIKSYISKTIRSNEETKLTSVTAGFTGYNSSISSVGDYVTCLPPVPQGTGQSQRIGQAIRPIKLVIRGYVIYSADSQLNARMIGGRMFCFSDKTVSNYGVATSAGANYNLLDVGGTSQTFDGTVARYEYPHNNDQFKFYSDKKFRMMKPWGYTNVGSTSTQAIVSMDKSMYRPFTITLTQKQLPAILKYDQQLNVNFPTNFAPYVALGYCDLLSYPADTVVTQLNMTFTSTLYFKDA